MSSDDELPGCDVALLWPFRHASCTRSNSPSSCDDPSRGNLVKRPWTAEEDHALVKAVRKFGACRWSIIATHLSSGRVGKQCRERCARPPV